MNIKLVQTSFYMVPCINSLSGEALPESTLVSESCLVSEQFTNVVSLLECIPRINPH